MTSLAFVINGCIKQVAAGSYCAELLDEVLAQGGSVNTTCQDALGLAPLHVAVLEQDRDLTEFLFQRGADANVQASGERYKGMTPLRFAQELDKKRSPATISEIKAMIASHGGHN